MPAPGMDHLLERGIALFNHGEFFECHEVLEEAWTPERDPRRLFLQALIHLAVGFYHHTRGNTEGATRQLHKGLRKLSRYLPTEEAIDTARLEREVRETLTRIDAGQPVPAYPLIHLA